MRVAAVDIGTNTVRLLVADAGAEGYTEVERGRYITRLGKGVDADRRLDPEAIERTLDAIDACVRRARDLGAESTRVAGTSALRDAADRDSFIERVHAKTGQRLEILSGPDEGRLSLLGATSGLPVHQDYVVCDIGGGSTELSSGLASMSLDVGSVRLKERFLHDDPPTSDQISSARHFVDSALEGTDRLLINGHETFVGVAGTITTVAAFAAGLTVYDRDVVHGSKLSREIVDAWSRRLLRMTTKQILELGAVEAGRADVVAGGALILQRVMRHFLFGEVVVSEHDILDGLVLDMVSNR